MTFKSKITLLAAVLVACFSNAWAQTQVFSDPFANFASLAGWPVIYNSVQASVVNEQFVLSENWNNTFDPNNPLTSFGLVGHTLPPLGPLVDGETLEFRVDLVGVNQNGVATDLHYFNGVNHGYVLSKTQNGITIFKF